MSLLLDVVVVVVVAVVIAVVAIVAACVRDVIVAGCGGVVVCLV